MSKTENKQKNSTLSVVKNTMKKFMQRRIIFLISFILLSALSIVALMWLAAALFLGTFSQKTESKTLENFEKAKAEFEKRTSINNTWFEDRISFPDTLFFINVKDTVFIYNIDNTSEKISYKSIKGNNSVKHIADQDTAKFDSFINLAFNIGESNSIDSLADKIGAKTSYLPEIDTHSGLNLRDKVFSLIYNTIAGDDGGHVAVTLKNKKIRILTDKDILCDRIDKNLFTKSMNEIVGKDTLSNKDKFIWASYLNLSSGRKHSNANTNSIQAILNQYFNNEDVVIHNQKLPFDFLYYDFRKDILHIGSKQYQYSKDVDSKIKKYVDTIKQLPEAIFYLVSDSVLISLPDLPANDSIVWGKINIEELLKGKFTHEDTARDYGVIKTWGKPVWFYFTILVLLAYILISSLLLARKFLKSKSLPASSDRDHAKEKWGYTNTVDKEQGEDSEQEYQQYKKLYVTFKGLSEGRLVMDDVLKAFEDILGEKSRAEFEKLLEKEQKVWSDATIQNFIKDLGSNKNDTPEKVKTDLKECRSFYLDFISLEKEKDLLNWIDKFRNKNKKIPHISSLKKIYEELKNEKNGDKDGIIKGLLTSVDQFAKDNELSRQFEYYRIQANEYAQCNTLLEKTTNESFYTYLNKKVNKLAEGEQEISDFVEFTLIFRPQGHIFKTKDEILKVYEKTRQQVEEFFTLCQSLPERDNNQPNFWDRIALSVWSISQIAIPMLKIWKNDSKISAKADETINSLKSDLLQIYVTRYFLRYAKARSSSPDDFQNAVSAEIPKAIADYNQNIAKNIDARINNDINDGLKNELTVALEKIKKSEYSEEFIDKMWQNFVGEFLKKAPDLNEQSPTDKAWFFGQLFNISYQTVDYIDFVKNNKKIIYCYNHLLLHNNFDLSKTDHYEFQVNHMEKSTGYSNRVYKWANELGIKQLKILIEKYYIKP